MTDHLRMTTEDGVRIVTLDIPPVNAQSRDTWLALTRAFDDISADDSVRVAILTGAGKFFSAGADIKAAKPDDPSPGEEVRALRDVREALNAVMECRKPVIAAINGPAIGLGVSLIAVCDILLCADDAYFALPEINVGLLGGARHAMRILPHSLLRRLFFTGGRADARSLARMGIIEDCLPRDELLPAALAMARDIAAKSPLALRMAKETFSAIEDMTIRDGYRYEQAQLLDLSKSADAVEARQAFSEGRLPRFSGR